jgi:hypothetical protein
MPADLLITTYIFVHCVKPPLGSIPVVSQPEMENLALDGLATDPTYVNSRKMCRYRNFFHDRDYISHGDNAAVLSMFTGNSLLE